MKKTLIYIALLALSVLLLSACQPEVVEVTRVVTETEVVTEQIEVTRIVEGESVTEQIEVTRVVEVAPEVVDFGNVLILSTQAVPVEEAERMRGIVLADFPGQPEFVGVEEPVLLDRVLAEAEAGEGSVDVVISLHGTFPTLLEANAMMDLSDMTADLAEHNIPSAFMDLGKLGTDAQYYIPLMQATYILAVNNVALEYLPEGADTAALTWENVRDWARNISEATGDNKLGFPASDQGLLHRFLEGSIYPSYTGGMVTGFRSDEAVAMWEFVRDMWQYVNPQASTYAFMQEQLLSEEVWIAWDHTARLREAFEQQPDVFLALPSPTGPAGLGFMPVIVGVSIPANAPNPEGAQEMVRYLLQDEVQVNILREIGFFPVTDVEYPGFVSAGVRLEAAAVAQQANSPNALPALLPVGLGDRGGEINKIYRDAFTRIIINEEDIATVLAEEGANLQTLMDETGAPCWPPDPPSEGPCQLQE
ncbi:MAG: ABC transporter substrate-binding protein [Chloroflexi bacterium]|nr:ABC transporter substrate-binding protein [Chloroflexota bacterium]MCI0580453.1 ABC transporter substrate-binding protein [Chloroflexota bacterium]MCI0649197.1 ABC transporter substrate-binding protein [Chloroflexota bacterium]MCI0727991.1 ABC transporter substrate-binding protein [Chloroflexota bacterium]